MGLYEYSAAGATLRYLSNNKELSEWRVITNLDAHINI